MFVVCLPVVFAGMAAEFLLGWASEQGEAEITESFKAWCFV